jgi:predicted RNA methylase
MLDEIILQSAGRFVTVVFEKKNGELRTLTGRLGVTKHLKGGTSTLNPDAYITIYDVVNKGYRAVNRETIRSVTINHETHA